MILTEEEAKTKICHETLAGIHDPSGGTIFDPSCCIGSACMAWRWHRGDLKQTREDSSALPKHFTIEGKGEYSTTLGYCGKAGKP